MNLLLCIPDADSITVSHRTTLFHGFSVQMFVLSSLTLLFKTDGINKCYQCLSFYQNVYYPQCPRNGRVRNAYLAPCNGSCFTRTYDRDEKIIARGCTDYLHGLPKPLPPDGCYKWYTEIWCVCSNSRCNGAAL
ncbi:unnamed protein product, partial [Candidula unifasciata]